MASSSLRRRNEKFPINCRVGRDGAGRCGCWWRTEQSKRTPRRGRRRLCSERQSRGATSAVGKYVARPGDDAATIIFSFGASKPSVCDARDRKLRASVRAET